MHDTIREMVMVEGALSPVLDEVGGRGLGGSTPLFGREAVRWGPGVGGYSRTVFRSRKTRFLKWSMVPVVTPVTPFPLIMTSRPRLF